MRLDDRIKTALQNGPLDTYRLADIVWPQETHARSWRNQTNGGPPAWVLALGKAIRRLGLRVDHRDGKKYLRLPDEQDSK
jgi:hypothetical protein